MGNKYDLLIIGAGPGGYVAAIKAAGLGMKVAVIDERELGGTCMNRGCIPTKALIHASSLYREMKSCDRFGLKADHVGYDLKKIYAYKDKSARILREDIAQLFRENGVEFYQGMATVCKDKRVRVVKGDEEQILEGRHILIATGAKPIFPDIPGIHLPDVVTSEELLFQSDKQYERLVIIGGGVIGVELATVFNALGTQVTIIEASPRLLPAMDREISESLEIILRQRGIAILTNTRVEKIEKNGELHSHFLKEGKETYVSSDGILVAIGRNANTENLFEEDVPVRMEHGQIKVNEFFMTNISGIYAIGDVIGGIQLAHVASAQGTYVVERMNDMEPSVVLSMVPSGQFLSLPIVPSCLYTDPEIASVGLSEEEALARGVQVHCGKYIMSSNGKSIISMEEQGFIKVVFAADSDVLLGAQMMCARATDMIGEMATAIANGLTSTQLMYAMRAHPTFNEAISGAVEASRKGAR